MKLNEQEVANLVTTLNLEYGATQRYEYQIATLLYSNVNTVLEGVMRSEGDHVEASLAYLSEEPAADIPTGF